jgi:hypothetical protein
LAIAVKALRKNKLQTALTSMHGDDTALPTSAAAGPIPSAVSTKAFYKSKGEKKAENVVVLGQLFSQKLFGQADPTGQALNRTNTPELAGVFVRREN